MGKMKVPEYLPVFGGRRVMITGHTGFKGTWLAFLLKEIGADVLGYALPPTDKNSHFDLLKLDKSIRHVEADIRDEQKLKRIMKEFQPQIVFHLAAQALVRPSYADPKVTFDTNVMGAVNLLEAVLLQINVMRIWNGNGVIEKMTYLVDMIHIALLKLRLKLFFPHMSAHSFLKDQNLELQVPVQEM